MMPQDFRPQIEEVQAAIRTHAAIMERKALAGSYDQISLARDMAVGIEMAQKYTDLLGQISEALQAEQ